MEVSALDVALLCFAVSCIGLTGWLVVSRVTWMRAQIPVFQWTITDKGSQNIKQISHRIPSDIWRIRRKRPGISIKPGTDEEGILFGMGSYL